MGNVGMAAGIMAAGITGLAAAKGLAAGITGLTGLAAGVAPTAPLPQLHIRVGGLPKYVEKAGRR
jgi:hypothetical protein